MGLYFSTLFGQCITQLYIASVFSKCILQVYFPSVFLRCILGGVQFMCNFDAGGNRGAGTIKSGIGSLWGISIMGSNTIVAQEQLFMPRFRNRGARVKNIILFFFCFE